MKFNVMDIPEDGMNLEASAAGDPWLQEVVRQSFGEDFPQGGQASLDVHLIRTAKNIQVNGDAHIDLKPACDRCLESFSRHLDVPLHVNMAPKKDLFFAQEEERELDPDDVNFSFYEGEEIDLAQILGEMLVLEIPLRYLCSEECKGLCPKCGQNLNVKACGCASAPADPRFAVLKELIKKT